jgi:hypothetical protein
MGILSDSRNPLHLVVSERRLSLAFDLKFVGNRLDGDGLL